MARMVETASNGGAEIDGKLLATIAATAASAVPGVARLHDSLPDRILRSIRRGDAVGGVEMRRTPEGLDFDVQIVIEPEIDMVPMARRVESEVAEAVRRVDDGALVEVRVHIRDVSDG